MFDYENQERRVLEREKSTVSNAIQKSKRMRAEKNPLCFMTRKLGLPFSEQFK